jgi:glutamine amidotransferase
MITIVDYGIGNLGSVVNMFKKIGIVAEASSDIGVIERARKIVLPGVGAFDTAMNKLESTGLFDVVLKKASVEKVPFLGICLGMQLLTEESEEGIKKGLGLVKAKTLKFSFAGNDNYKIPHMGWNMVSVRHDNPIIKGKPEENRYYFIHSYYVKADDEKSVLGRTMYGHEFDSVITNGDNVFGMQFHPEKSHKFGMRLFQNFAAL